MAIQVLSAGWHVGDGEPEVRVGEQWTARIEVKRLGAVTRNDWHPEVQDLSTDAAPRLIPIPQAAAAYEFVANSTRVGSRWTVLAVGSARFAVPGTHESLVSGRGVFVHDTYFIGERVVIESLEIDLKVERIEWAAAGTQLLSLDANVDLREIQSTYQRLSEEGSPDGTFIITGRPA